MIDLAAHIVLPFDYGNPRKADQFDLIVERMLAHRLLVIATPVYWYAMSGLMKTFFDRLSDLLSPRDPARRGRSLAGRRMWLLAVGTDAELPNGFEVPFAATADYLGLDWRGACYCRTGRSASAEENDRRIGQLAAELSRACGG